MAKTFDSVDVVMVVHKRAGYLEFLADAIRSLKSQTKKPRFVHMVSDGEDPEGDAEVTRLAGEDLAFRFSFWKPPAGYLSGLRAGGRAPVSRNIGIYKCSADWVALMDDDDWWEPTYLEKAVYLGMEREADVVVGHTFSGLDRTGGKQYDGCFSEQKFFTRNPGVNGSNLVFRRTSLLEIGGYNPSVLGGADKEVMIRLMRNGGRSVVLKEPLVCHRHHPGQDSANLGRRIMNRRALLKIHGKSMGLGTRMKIWAKILLLERLKTSEDQLAAGKREPGSGQ